MLTNQDIKKLIKVFATREEIVTKIEFDDLKKGFRRLQNVIDAYAKKADIYFQEMLMLAHKVDRLEKWVLQIAQKIGLQLKP